MKKRTGYPPLHIVIILFLTISGIYVYSLCPSVYLIDSGELAAVSYTLGIAHPTGYPLYTIVSYFFAHVGVEPVYSLNILSALLSTTAAAFLYLTACIILKNAFLPLLPVSLFAFAPIVWRTSVTNEVYPLTILFSLFIIYCLYRMRDARHFYILMYLAGMSMTNHMMIFALLIPVIVYSIIVYRIKLPKILLGGALALIGASLYLYLPARTIGGAVLNWGNTYDLLRLFWHMTGRQYQVWMFSLPPDEILRNLSNGLGMLLRNLLYLFVVGLFAGLYHLFRYDRAKFWLFVSIIILNIAYTVNYSIPDIEAYYVPALTAGTVVIVYGMRYLLRYARWFLVVPLALVIPLVNYGASTLRGNSFGLDFGQLHTEQLPERSMLICTYWDVYSPLMYLRHVKDARRDIIMIDKELLRRTWYIDHLRHEYPGFFSGIEKPLERYLAELHKFEYGKPYNATLLQKCFIDLLQNIVNHAPGRIYLAAPAPDYDLAQVHPQVPRLPYGMVFELCSDTADYEPFNFSRLPMPRPGTVNDQRLRINIQMLQRMTRNNIRFLTVTGSLQAADQAQAWLTAFSSRAE